MSPAASPLTATGTSMIAGRVVHWRIGVAEHSATATLRETAYGWLEDLVRRHDLFRWAGVARTGPGVKPRPNGDPDADFSLSHSGRLVLVAVARGRGIGADVESGPFRAFESAALLRRMCAPREHERLLRRPAPQRRLEAAALWTAKEAAVKASGLGMAEDFRSFEIAHAPTPAHPRASAHLAVVDERGTHVHALEHALLPV